MEIKEAIRLARHMAAQKQRAAAMAREFGDVYASDLLDLDVEALEMLIDIAERWKANGD